ncbi:hypothetical protein ON010_g1565 [Phytophthora cinnamomi]|nr:hypothetical protein ON010_g1565 [Phytophthora cinnamomi]
MYKLPPTPFYSDLSGEIAPCTVPIRSGRFGARKNLLASDQAPQEDTLAASIAAHYARTARPSTQPAIAAANACLGGPCSEPESDPGSTHACARQVRPVAALGPEVAPALFAPVALRFCHPVPLPSRLATPVHPLVGIPVLASSPPFLFRHQEYTSIPELAPRSLANHTAQPHGVLLRSAAAEPRRVRGVRPRVRLPAHAPVLRGRAHAAKWRAAGKVDAGTRLVSALTAAANAAQVADCPKADVGGGFCTAHGGGKRCSEPGCTKIDQGGGKCRAHGGARRCRRRNCQQPARGATGFCTEHGGSRVCSAQSCRRLVRSPNDTGTLCATCARQKESVAEPTLIKKVDENVADSDRSNDSPQNSAMPTPLGSDASVLGSFSPLASNARCDGSQMANCLDNGCSRSFGGDCNCAGDSCSCNSPTLSTSRAIPHLSSSNTITAIASTSNQTLNSDGFERLMRSSSASTLTPRATLLPRFVLQIKPFSSLLGIETIASMLSTLSGVRSVHVVSGSTASSSGRVTPSETELLGTSTSNSPPTSRLVIVRGEQTFDLEVSLATLRSLQLAHISVVEQSSTTWARKEVVLRVPDMMCPGNCGTSVLNAVRAVDGVEAARLRFEHRHIVIRGDMNVDDIRTAVTDIGFDSIVDATTLLPRRFRFRVDDLSDVGLNGPRLEDALKAVEGVENLVLLTDRVEVLVVAMLLDSSSLVEAAESVGFEMLELSEEAWGIPMEVVQSSVGSSNDADSSDDYHKSHQCDLNICPQNGCPRYMTTVAHTAALAVGWAVPGCGMSFGGECTCGDSCKCEGCPEHNPAS